MNRVVSLGGIYVVGFKLIEQAPALIRDVIDRVIVLGHGELRHEGPAGELGADQLRDLYLGAR